MSPSPSVLERTSSAPRRPSLPRPTLPSLASWTASTSFTPTKLPALNPPTSAGSTSSVEADEAITPGELPHFPAPPPTHLKMASPQSQDGGEGFSPAIKPPLAGFRVQDIPPFRGSGGPTSLPNLDRRPSTAGAPSLSASAGATMPPSAVPTSLASSAGGYRRASVASVFSLPRPHPPAPTSAPARQPSQPPSQQVTMGLGIAGVGVGQSGQREALVIERLGEPSRDGRRGSLKRVLISEDEEDQDALRASLGSRDSDRSRMDLSDSSIPLPLQQPSVLAPAPPHRNTSPLNPSSAAGSRRAGSSSPPQPVGMRHASTSASASASTGRDSPTASKRARTALSPLESLAATATNLLTAPSVASSTSSSGTPARPPSASGIPSVLASFMLGQSSAPPPPTTREQAAAIEATQRLREQHEQRRAAQPPAPGSLGAALGKLRATAEAEGLGPAASSTSAGGGGGAPGSRSKSAIPLEGGSGLGKRRGHRPPAVNTAAGSSAAGPPSASSSARAHPYPPPSATGNGPSSSRPAAAADDTLAPLRPATGLEIPSVLVGSPVDPSFAARAARELAPMRAAQTGPTRRQSRSGAPPSAASLEREREEKRERDERPYPSVVAPAAQQSNQPPLVSSSTYYIRPNQPLGPGVAFPSSSSSSAAASGSTPAAGSSSSNKALPPPPPSAGPRLPSFASASASARASPPQPGFHPLHHQQHPHSQQQQQQRPLSAGGPVSPRAPVRGAAPPSSASLASPAQYAAVPPPSSASLHPPPPQSAPALSTSASTGGAGVSTFTPPSSKTAFLSLFSTFYDSLSDSRVLSSSLETQIARASQLLHTLQHAETVLERMVDERVGRIERANEERWKAVEGRLGALERRAAQASRPVSAAPMAMAQDDDDHRLAHALATRALDDRRGSGDSVATARTSASASASASAVEERLERIERALQVQEAAGEGSRPSTSSGVGEEEREREKHLESVKEAEGELELELELGTQEGEAQPAVEGEEEEMPER
ncbi:hypothetical protein JCM6882_005109 [Rhodosporidiobolus microsporus]